MFIHLNIFSWLTSLGKLVSQRDGARAKRRGSCGEHCFFFCVLRVKQQGHVEVGWGCWGSWPWPVLCSGCRSERAPDPLGANARGWSRFAMGREAACLLPSASVQSLCSGCPVLFCTFRRGFFFFNLYSRNVTSWLLFFVCSRALRCKPRAPSKRCFYILHSIHCFAAACGDAGLLQEVVECSRFTSPSAWHS